MIRCREGRLNQQAASILVEIFHIF
jgi:hypothetical protein